MATVQFDQGAADRLAAAATSAADVLTGQAGTRRTAAETAAEDFHGAYADRFLDAVQVEAGDRPKLVGVLTGLADLVTVVADEARREQERQADLAAWHTRDAARQREAAEGPLGAVAAWGQGVFDQEPSDPPVVPTPIDATFSARPRTRTGSGAGSSHGRSSAKPSSLRSFSEATRAADTAAQASLVTLRNAWTAFRSSCSWARVDGATFIGGFERLLAENGDDATWVDGIADAFERAGGGHSIANTALDMSLSGALTPALRAVLADGLSAEEVAALWGSLPWTHGTEAEERDLAALPLPVLAELGNLEGVPYWVRNTANRTVLAVRIDEAERSGSGNLAALEKIRESLKSKGRDGDRSLIALTDDEPPLAAVSIGNLDTADDTTFFVPGMGSSTSKMTDLSDAAQNVYDAQGNVDKGRSHAVVAWMGYESPPIPGPSSDLGVFTTAYARKGADRLAASIRGLTAVRGDDDYSPNVLAHSYGTTTASLALTKPGVHVDSFTTIASAGIPDEITSAGMLHADHVYSGQAQSVLPGAESGKGDQWAQIGRDYSSDHHVDPTEQSFGSTPFEVDGTDTLRGTHDHGVHNAEKNGDTGYLDPGTQSLQQVAYATTGQGDQLTPAGPYTPTHLQEYLANPHPVPVPER